MVKLTLARRTREGGAPAVGQPDHRPLAARTTLALAPVHPPLLGEITQLAVGASVIAQGRTARLYRCQQHTSDGLDQCIEPFSRDLSGE